MEFSKCSRCGAFYVSKNNVCPNCEPKDNNDKIILQDYLKENNIPSSIEQLSLNTGISVKNLNRFLSEENEKNNFYKL